MPASTSPHRKAQHIKPTLTVGPDAPQAYVSPAKAGALMSLLSSYLLALAALAHLLIKALLVVLVGLFFLPLLLPRLRHVLQVALEVVLHFYPLRLLLLLLLRGPRLLQQCTPEPSDA
jgi:hypothetical protein